MFIINVFRLGGDKFFSCFFAGFLLFSPKGSVMDVYPHLGVSVILELFFFLYSCIFFQATIITTM